jgi:hypothetical protein
MHLVKEQAHPARTLSAGLAALPGAGSAWASTQAAWRFFNNEAITPAKLAGPLREAVRRALDASRSDYALVVVDWSKIDYRRHASKADRRGFCNPGEAGYALTAALAVDAATGGPIGPLELELDTAVGTLTTRGDGPRPSVHYVEQVAPLMGAAEGWGLPRTPVFVMDREYDSLEHYRAWHADGRRFLVRADAGRRLRWGGRSALIDEVVAGLRDAGAFAEAREVTYHGRPMAQFVAEAAVVLDQPAWKHKADGTRKKVPGPPLPLRLIVAEVRDGAGEAVATWLLLTNVPAEVAAVEVALWYYWRWGVESTFKLLKSAGVELERWQQETAAAILRRLLVACMACVTVWHLESRSDPASEACKRLLARLSGRLTRRSRPVTSPALLAGLRTLLVIEEVLDDYGVEELLRVARPILDDLRPP